MGKRRVKTPFDDSAIKNNQSFNHYYQRLTEIAVSMFEWKNLPKTIDERFLEMTLFTQGKAIFFKDEELDGYLALYCAASGPFNIYNIPINRRAYASNGYNNGNLNDKNSVIIYNNYVRTNTMQGVEWFADRLWNLDRVIDVNTNAQKTPMLLLCDEKQLLTMKNVYQKIDGNQPAIFAGKNFDMDSIKAVTTGAPYVADRIYALKMQIWDEAMTYLGVSNMGYEKKERMFTREVNATQGGVIANRHSRLEMRRQACEQINEMFGLNIECNYRDEFVADPKYGGNEGKNAYNTDEEVSEE